MGLARAPIYMDVRSFRSDPLAVWVDGFGLFDLQPAACVWDQTMRGAKDTVMSVVS